MSFTLSVPATITAVDIENQVAILNVDLRDQGPGQAGYITIEGTTAALSAATTGSCTVEISQ